MTLEERIVRLERRNRRANLAAVGLLVVGVAGGAFVGPFTLQAKGQPPKGPKVVEANEFRVVDENGKMRAHFKVDAHTAKLVFFGEHNDLRAALGVDPDGTRLVLADDKGRVRVGLDVLRSTPRLSLVDKDQNARVILTADNEGPSMMLFDEKTRIRSYYAVDRYGPNLVFYDETGAGRVNMIAAKDGSSLSLYDASEMSGAFLSQSATGPSLVLRDRAGKPRAEIGPGARSESRRRRRARYTWLVCRGQFECPMILVNQKPPATLAG